MRTGTAWSLVVVGLVMAGFSSHSSSSAAALARTGLVVGISFRWLVVVGHVCQTRSLEEDATPLSTGAGDGNVNVTAVENREHCVGIPAGGNSGSNPGLGGALRPTSQSCKNLRHPAPLRQGGLPPFPPLLFYYTSTSAQTHRARTSAYTRDNPAIYSLVLSCWPREVRRSARGKRCCAVSLVAVPIKQTRQVHRRRSTPSCSPRALHSCTPCSVHSTARTPGCSAQLLPGKSLRRSCCRSPRFERCPL